MNSYDSVDEQLRLEALLSLDILDTPEEEQFDELVHLASQICDTPISLVSLVDRNRQWFKASVGLTAKETHRDVSFCSHAIQRPELFVVENAMADDRFRENSLVTGPPGILFYAGMPLQAPNGYAVGTLCVIDTVPRRLTDNQINALKILARQVRARMELRLKQKSLEEATAVNERLLATLRDSNHLFSAFMNNGPFISYIKDEEGRFIFCNDRLKKLLGDAGDEIAGRTGYEVFTREDADRFRDHDLRVLKGGVPVELAEEMQQADGSVSRWKSFKFPLRRGNGELMLAGVSIDVTEEEKRKAELDRVMQEKLELARSLEASTILIQTFVDNNPNACFFKDADGRYLSYNSKFEELFGIEGKSWIGKTDYDVHETDFADSIRSMDVQILQADEIRVTSRRLKNGKGEWVWLKTFRFPIKSPDGRKILAGVSIDLTREVEREEALSEANRRLEELATIDALTGLANRRVFEEKIMVEFAKATRKNRALTLLVMDIDDFKKRNDTLGHAAGDDCLRLFGKVLTRSVRLGDVTARIGGEEFAILLPETDAEGATILARRIQAGLRSAETGPLPLTVSIGIAQLDAATEGPDALMSRADAAMYTAKRSGKDRCVVAHQLGATVPGSRSFPKPEISKQDRVIG